MCKRSAVLLRHWNISYCSSNLPHTGADNSLLVTEGRDADDAAINETYTAENVGTLDHEKESPHGSMGVNSCDGTDTVTWPKVSNYVLAGQDKRIVIVPKTNLQQPKIITASSAPCGVTSGEHHRSIHSWTRSSNTGPHCQSIKQKFSAHRTGDHCQQCDVESGSYAVSDCCSRRICNKCAFWCNNKGCQMGPYCGPCNDLHGLIQRLGPGRRFLCKICGVES